MAKRPLSPQLAFSFDEPAPAAPVAKSQRLGTGWRYPGDPDTPEGKAMPNRCQNTFPELGGLQCLLKTYGKYCDTCARQKET